MRVLIVDDDPTIRRLLSMILEQAEHDVLEASNGPEAMARLHDDPGIQCMILDACMPGMTGPELLWRLERKQPPTLGLTGDYDVWRNRLLGAGAAEVMPKPFDPSTLLAAVERVGTGGRRAVAV